MTKAKDPLRGFVKQLVSGKEEQEKLDSIMRDLRYAKQDLDQRSRIIRENEATEWALQVNTPIGVDVWKDMDSVTIERNKATGNASQWNYPMVSVDAFLAALEMRRPAGPD
ncbi:hypothetical protein H0G86_007379 [Trichoderma simmonsii]|uniref:Uncharacterized protein n=1 Tax=Trichoderma simmonsii TaxID=1491479 RepID=A0A8G0LFC2_9HYPO|nr:hypothetical protein H0G86_007379 [Trichoderma simmonsii]